MTGLDNNPQYDDNKFVGELFGIGNSIYASASNNTGSGNSTNTKYCISSTSSSKPDAMSTIIKKLGQSYSNDTSNSYYASNSKNSSSSLNGGGYSSNSSSSYY